MGKLLKGNRDGIYMFHCPGCEYGHWFSTTGFTPSQKKEDTKPAGPVWTWNGDEDKPTVRASILVRGQFTCHSFITDGKIQFMGDSNHKLSGQTVDLPEM
jgi:hypothetical protein